MVEKKFLLYTEHGCPRCEEIKDYLKDNNIDFDEVKLYKGERPDITEIPMICLENKCVVGFDKKALFELIKQREIMIEDGVKEDGK